MPLHAFVAMPFGSKEGVDFDAVYRDFIAPAVRAAGCEILRADDALLAGDIRTDMFQELLLADLVVVDLSIDNPNVWYELGVRHALRSRGVVHVRCRRERLPFDVHGERTLRYRVKDGLPDPAHLEADKALLTRFVAETMDSWRGRRHSPVYHLLPNLDEPDWRSLKVGTVNEFWDALERWEQRVELARRRGRAGDILVLAEEAPTWVLGLEARRAAGGALSDLGHARFALEQYEKALTIDPDDCESRRKKAIQLIRLARFDEAAIWVQDLLDDRPDDAEVWALLGRIKKETWLNTWRTGHGTVELRRQAAAAEDALLREAIEAYRRGFLRGPGDYYAGINAAALLRLHVHLCGEDEEDAEASALIEGGVRWAAQSALARAPRDYWAAATLAELVVLSGSAEQVADAYKAAAAVSERTWFKLDSSRQQLRMLQDLGFRPPAVEAGLAVLERELDRIAAPAARPSPRRVILFSGHMVDQPGRAAPRFPPDKVDLATAAIGARLDALEVGPGDVGLCGGACGGDLLFAEACLARGVELEVRLPVDEPSFLRTSVGFAGDAWRDRFYAVAEHPRVRVLVLPDELGPTPEGVDPYARNNLWQLNSALAYGPEKVRFLCLWDGKEGDGPGGTKHMLETVEARSGRVSVIDTSALFFGGPSS